jgi:hypothetical protein
MANQVGVTRPVRRLSAQLRAGLLAAGVLLPCGWMLAAPAQAAMPADAAATTQTMTLGDSVEAWYATSPVDPCSSPLGCPPSPVPTSAYPADTLHVGVAGGQETARTYVLPDLSSLPFGAILQSGVMTLPVATGTTDGTNSPASARIKVCLATTPATDGTQGSSATPPKVDCAISTEAKYDATKSLFTIDLTPFLTGWSSGAPEDLALIPDATSAQPTDAWHVTFNGRNRAAAPHISSVLTVSIPATTGGGTTTTSTATAVPLAQAIPPVAPVTLPSAPAVTGPTAQAPTVAGTPRPTPVATQPVAFAAPFQYPLAFLAPLALLAGAVFFVRLFTADPTPRRSST